MRADQLLLQRGLATSRSQAQRLIASGVRWRPDGPGTAAPWKAVVKNSDELPQDAAIELQDAAEARYVSRGGLKLEGALRHTGLSGAGGVPGKVCLDVGQSTGGFTDCLLQHGAARVVGIDVGSGQLHPRLREHDQVVSIENCNARDHELIKNALFSVAQSSKWLSEFILNDSEFLPFTDILVGDLSFISLTLVLPALVPCLKPGGHLLMLVKPQFELQPGQVGKGGLVKDPGHYATVETRLRGCCASLNLAVQSWFDSPITGGDGNREFFIHAIKTVE